MQLRPGFRASYLDLEARLKALAESEDTVFVPNPEPDCPVQYLLICMEPSLGRWARSVEHARARVRAGFRNFLFSMEDFILHFSVRRYLCHGFERYHVTDFSKGALLVKQANIDRASRYDRWYRLLLEEVDLVAALDAGIVAVGGAVAEQLEQRRFPRPFTRVIHYSGQAARARKAGIVGHEKRFEAFRNTVALDDLIDTAAEVLASARAPADIREETLSRLAQGHLTTSRLELIYNYRIAFEMIQSSRRRE